MGHQFSESNHVVKLFDPVADALAGTKRSAVINMKNFEHFCGLIHVGVGATGTSVVTVNACDDFVPTNRIAVPFRYREILTGDTPGNLTVATAAGFTTTAGSSRIVEIEVDAELLAGTNYPNIEITFAESVDSPVLAGGIGILSNPKHAAPFETAIA